MESVATGGKGAHRRVCPLRVIAHVSRKYTMHGTVTCRTSTMTRRTKPRSSFNGAFASLSGRASHSLALLHCTQQR